MPNHPRHRTTAGQEVTIAERIAGDHAVGSDQRVVSDPLDETEQRRSIDHLDFHQLLPGNFKDLCSLLDIVVVDQMLVGGEELGRTGVSPCWKESRLDGIEGFEVWNLNQNPTHLWIVLMAHSDLPHPVFLAILVEL